MFLCCLGLGPCCLPIILPALLFLFNPIYKRLSPENQRKFLQLIKYIQTQINWFWENIEWVLSLFFTKKTETSSENAQKTNCCDQCKDNKDNNGTCDNMIEDDSTLFYQLTDIDEWQDIINNSKHKNKPIFVYFTAEFGILFHFAVILARVVGNR